MTGRDRGWLPREVSGSLVFSLVSMDGLLEPESQYLARYL